MNQTNLARLIDHLRSIPTDRFDMEIYVRRPQDHDFEVDYVDEVVPNEHECGTVGCIAGHIALKFTKELDPGRIADAAGDWLGMTHCDSLELFLGHWTRKPRAEITLADTIQHLESLRNA